MAIIQTTVDDDIKREADAVFARSGLTTAMAVRVMVTQVAREGRSPFDGLFARNDVSAELAERAHPDMLRTEAMEYGIVPDESYDARELPDSALDILGLSEEEADFSKVTAEVNRTRRPVTLLKNNRPWVVVAPADPSAVDVASDFMDEYADVFEELAK